MSRHPELKWAQRADKVYLTVQLPDSKNAKVNLEPDGVFTFFASAGADNNPYEVKLDLYDKVNVEESKINYGVRSIFCIIEKAEKLWWKRLLRGDGKMPHYVKVDWDKWVDEDEDNGDDPSGMDMGGMDFSKFGGGGFGDGGMGGGPGGMDLGGMGGMGGMDFSKFGGGGGFGGGAMGDDFEESDDEELEVAKPDAGDKEAIEETKPVDKSEGGASEAKIETTKSS